MKVLVSGCFLFFSCLSSASAELEWESKILAFTAGFSEEKVTADFVFKNPGPGPVTIKDIRTSCGCTTAALDKKNYLPGETGSIRAVFDIGSRTGHQEKKIYVLTDQTRQASETLTFSVFIPEILSIRPQLVYWHQNQEVFSRIIRVIPRYPEPLNILSVSSENPVFQTRLVRIREGQEYEIEVTPGNLSRALNGTVTIRTALSSGESRSFKVYARILPSRRVFTRVPGENRELGN